MKVAHTQAGERIDYWEGVANGRPRRGNEQRMATLCTKGAAHVGHSLLSEFTSVAELPQKQKMQEVTLFLKVRRSVSSKESSHYCCHLHDDDLSVRPPHHCNRERICRIAARSSVKTFKK